MSSPKTKYDWTQFKMKVAIDRPVSVVFKAWTDDKEIVKWYVEKAIIDPRRNGRIYLELLTGANMGDAPGLRSGVDILLNESESVPRTRYRPSQSRPETKLQGWLYQ